MSGENHKDRQWVFNTDIQPETPAPGVARKALAYCDAAMCVENHFETGAVGAVHSHPHTQITYVAEGRFLFTVGAETREVRKGDTLCKQNGVKHGCVCLEKGVLVDFFTPMREDFINA
jgi:quercetin dioxygenase-like cupin family protein